MEFSTKLPCVFIFFRRLASRTLLAACIVTLVTSTNLVDAQLSLSPLYKKMEINENGQVQTTFSVINGSDKSVRFRANFVPFRFGKKSLELVETAEESGNDLSPYLRAAPLEFEVPSGSEQIVRVIALVPPSAMPSELRAALVVEPLTDTHTPLETLEDGVKGRVIYAYRFIAQLYVTRSGLQASLSIDKSTYNKEGTLSIEYVNSGSISGISGTTWQLKRKNQIILASEVPERFIVIPGETRNGVIAENLDLEPGTYTLTGTFGIDDGGNPPIILDPQPFTETFTVE